MSLPGILHELGVEPFDRGALVARLGRLLEPKTLSLCLAISFSLASTWLLNTVGYPPISAYCPSVQYVATMVGAALAGGCLAVSMYRPGALVSPRAFYAVLAGLVVSTGAMLVCSVVEAPALAIATACLRWGMCIVRDLFLGLALIGLEAETCIAVLAFSYLLRYVWIVLLYMAPPVVGQIAFLLFAPVGLVLLRPFAAGLARQVAAEDAPVSMSITNPLSFLPLNGLMFAAILFCQAAFGYSTTLGGSGGYAQGAFVTLVLFSFVATAVLVFGLASIDTLYGIAFLLALAGLALVPGLSGGEGALAYVCNSFCEAGSSLFILTFWFMGACVGRRHLVAALPVLALVRVARGLGIVLGSASGAATNHLSAARPDLASVFVAAILVVFVAFNHLFARVFSFDRTVRDVRPPDEPVVVEDADPQVSDVEVAASRLAGQTHLTMRETDVLLLLAKGRNVQYIQEELGLKRNTVKSYVADVYAKLGAHSHQEVIDLVEREMLRTAK